MSCWNPEIPLGLRLMENWNFWPCLPMAPFRPSSFMAASLLLQFIVKQESSWVIEDWPRVLDSCKNILEKFLLLLLIYIFMHPKTKFKKERNYMVTYTCAEFNLKVFILNLSFPNKRLEYKGKPWFKGKAKRTNQNLFML